jgi:hypothetical protein
MEFVESIGPHPHMTHVLGFQGLGVWAPELAEQLDLEVANCLFCLVSSLQPFQ